jgi:hypothetical protein
MRKQGADKQERAWNTPARGKITSKAQTSYCAEKKTLIQSPKGGFNQSIKKQNK